MLKKIFYDVINMNILLGVLLFMIFIYFSKKNVNEPYFQMPNQLQQIVLPEPLIIGENTIYANYYNSPIIDNTKNEINMLTINALKQTLKETKDKLNANSREEPSFNHRKAKLIVEDEKIYSRMVHELLTHIVNTTYSLGLKKIDGKTWDSDGNKYRDIHFVVEVEHPYNKVYKNANMEVTINYVVLNDYVRHLTVV